MSSEIQFKRSEELQVAENQVTRTYKTVVGINEDIAKSSATSNELFLQYQENKKKYDQLEKEYEALGNEMTGLCDIIKDKNMMRIRSIATAAMSALVVLAVAKWWSGK